MKLGLRKFIGAVLIVFLTLLNLTSVCNAESHQNTLDDSNLEYDFNKDNSYEHLIETDYDYETAIEQDHHNRDMRRKVIDVVTHELLKEYKICKPQEARIYKELELLQNVGIPIGEIDSVNIDNDIRTYLLPITENLNDEIKIEKNSSNDIIMNVTEGNIANELIIKPDGTRILDGYRII